VRWGRDGRECWLREADRRGHGRGAERPERAVRSTEHRRCEPAGRPTAGAASAATADAPKDVPRMTELLVLLESGAGLVLRVAAILVT
jgi:hypothetical protein